MTRGYFVIEKNGKVLKAVELTGSAYLEDGYGESILEAYNDGTEREYLNSMYEDMYPEQKAELADIWPGWYRKTAKTPTGACFAAYGYVIQGDELLVYHDGYLLFKADRRTADTWLHIVRNLSRYENTYLYNEDKLDMEYQREREMFSSLQEQILKGITVAELEQGLQHREFEPVILEDMHCVDVWHWPDKPAYQKKLRQGSREVNFITCKRYEKWELSIQLPYMRVSILDKYDSEKQAMNALRKFIRSHLDELIRFVEVSSYVKNRLAAVRKKPEFDQDEQRKELEEMYREEPWFCANRHFTVQAIMCELLNALRKSLEQPKH